MVADHLAILPRLFLRRHAGLDSHTAVDAKRPRVLRLLNRYRTICYYSKPGAEVRQIVSLNAANMALRKELLDVAGLFDERIGPGASGTSMDVEFGERVLRAGRRIGYEPRSVVYHDVDWSRLTEAYFKRRHELQGRSRAIYKATGVSSSLGNLVRAAFGFCLYTALRNERQIYRSKGRLYHYRAMLKDPLAPQVAASSFRSPPPALDEREAPGSKS
jgi:GT2 family glycosyltransferase